MITILLISLTLKTILILNLIIYLLNKINYFVIILIINKYNKNLNLLIKMNEPL